ncbi:MAG TPA: hypothetical protein VF058_04105 [Actinomycetota bacterium]
MLRSERGSGSVLTIATILLGAALAIGFPVWMLIRGTQMQAESAAVGVQQAEDLRADALLTGAAGVAHSYLATQGSFQGFSPQAAAALDPSFRWNADPVASSGTVSIRGVTATSVALVTVGSGRPLCLAIDSGQTRRGTTDARSAADCTGGS